MNVQRIPFQPTYTRPSGLFVVNRADIPIPKEFVILDESYVFIPPQQVGGNHTHSRTEVFLGFGVGLWLYWVDERGTTHKLQVQPLHGLQLLIVSGNTPHAVVNDSSDEAGVLWELADEVQRDVIPYEVIHYSPDKIEL